MRHGSYPGAQAHYRAGEKPCEACRGARNEYARIYRRFGPLAEGGRTSARIYEFLVMNGPAYLGSVQEGVVGKPETIRRTLYRMVDRGEIDCDTYTRLYTVTNEKG